MAAQFEGANMRGEAGGANELMAGTHYYSTTGIAARGRIYVAGDNKV
jgi:hypothetical protein